MTDVAHTPTPSMPAIRQVDKSRPWMWLAAGWADLLKAPGTSLTYGLIFFVAGHAIGITIWWFDVAYLVLPLSAGFMLLGPILAVGLYDTSRRLEQNEPAGFGDTFDTGDGDFQGARSIHSWDRIVRQLIGDAIQAEHQLAL